MTKCLLCNKETGSLRKIYCSRLCNQRDWTNKNREHVNKYSNERRAANYIPHPATGSNHWRYRGKGSTYIDNNGYSWIKINEETGKESWMYEHRRVMEQHIGRKLIDVELVHHKDENKQNNHISNLDIVSREEHKRIYHEKIGEDTRWQR